MKPTVYIETTVFGYLIAHQSRDVFHIARELATREWWGRQLRFFDVFTSELVIQEAAWGEPGYAARRISQIGRTPLLSIHPATRRLTDELATAMSSPPRARLDAAHIAIAAVHGIAFLLTWDCKRLANAILADRIERTCREAGVAAPRIVTPEMLMEVP